MPCLRLRMPANRHVALRLSLTAQGTFGFQILPSCGERLFDLSLRALCLLGRLISGEALMAQLGLEIMNSMPRSRQQPFHLLACSGLRLQGLTDRAELIDVVVVVVV
jgi:hypothetical protein